MRLRGLIVFLSFFLAIALFYLRLPLNGSLFGDWDTWANLAMFMELRTWLESVATGTDPGQFFYPYEHPWVAYGLDFFSGIIWVVYTWLGIDEFWAYWLCMVTILALNGLAAFTLGRTVGLSTLPAWTVGVILSTHAYIIGYLDWPNLVAFFPALWVAHHGLLALRTGQARHALFAGLWFNVSLLLSPYSTFYLVIAGTIFGVFQLSRLLLRHGRLTALFVLSIAPLVLLYLQLYAWSDPSLVDPFVDERWRPQLYLHLADILRPSHGHLIHRFGDSFTYPAVRSTEPVLRRGSSRSGASGHTPFEIPAHRHRDLSAPRHGNIRGRRSDPSVPTVDRSVRLRPSAQSVRSHGLRPDRLRCPLVHGQEHCPVLGSRSNRAHGDHRSALLRIDGTPIAGLRDTNDSGRYDHRSALRATSRHRPPRPPLVSEGPPRTSGTTTTWFIRVGSPKPLSTDHQVSSLRCI